MEVDQALAKLLALLRIRDSLIKSPLHDANAQRGDERARQVQCVQRDAHAFARLADNGTLRHTHVVHDNFSGVRKPKAHLILMGAGRKARRVTVYQKRRNTVAARLGVGFCEDDVDGSDRAVCDEALRAVEHILVAIEHSGRLHARDIGACACLG